MPCATERAELVAAYGATPSYPRAVPAARWPPVVASLRTVTTRYRPGVCRAASGSTVPAGGRAVVAQAASPSAIQSEASAASFIWVKPPPRLAPQTAHEDPTAIERDLRRWTQARSQ